MTHPEKETHLTDQFTFERLRRSQGRRLLVRGFALIAVVVLAGCAAPIGVEKISSRQAQRAFNDNVLSTGKLSANARILLRRMSQEEAWKDDPAEVLAYLHSRLLVPSTEFTAELRMSLLDDMAELAFSHATKSGDRRYFLAAAMYAWVYLFPEEGSPHPPPLDRGQSKECRYL